MKNGKKEERQTPALPVAALNGVQNGVQNGGKSGAERREKNETDDFARSVTAPLGKNNERRAAFLLAFILTAIVLLLAAAVADLLTLAFQVHRVFGYVCTAAAAAVIVFFVLCPLAQVLRSRSFITDVAAENKDPAVRKNYRALKQAATELVRYNRDEKNAKYRYVKEERLKAIEAALNKSDKKALKKAMRAAYATDVGATANAVIFKSAGRAFLTTSVSQNDKIDAISVLLVNLSLIKQIVAIYGYRPTRMNLVKIYAAVLRNSLIAYGMQNVNWFNVFGKFFSGVTQKIPFLDTLVDSAVQGTVSAFLTLLIGYKTKRYLCRDYKKQEKLDPTEADDVPSSDDEVKIAASLAKEIRKDKGAYRAAGAV
ncbi:MAG: DUF697 domain-containing protein [Candidatus Borkfalkiaceae bacterium]|nr:DUF697 domain-containing protein [Clostridia bacterium]MDY6222906.1 DUF697 domain-containing protein [Christensenellaceae bacterium]